MLSVDVAVSLFAGDVLKPIGSLVHTVFFIFMLFIQFLCLILS